LTEPWWIATEQRDGVLFNFTGGMRSNFRSPKRNLMLPGDTGAKNIGGIAPGRKDGFFQTQPGKCIKALSRISSVVLTAGQCKEKFNIYLQAVERELRLFKAVRPCLSALEGQRLGYINSGPCCPLSRGNSIVLTD
jgi:hypothetical protein